MGSNKKSCNVYGFKDADLKKEGLRDLRLTTYQGAIPDVKDSATGDVELWFNTIIPWDAEDPKTVLAPGDAQIVTTRP